MFAEFEATCWASRWRRTRVRWPTGFTALARFEADQRERGARDAAPPRARGPPRHRAARPALPQRPGHQPRDPRGVPEARLPDPERRPSLPLDPESLEQLFGEEVARRAHARGARAWPMSGRTATARTRAARSGRPSTWPGTRTWWRWSCPTSSAGTTRRSTPWWRRSSRRSGTPYFCFKDIDENKPAGSIKIRVETIDYFLRTHREQLVKLRHKRERVERELAELERRLRGGEPAVAASPEDAEAESAAAAAASRRAS